MQDTITSHHDQSVRDDMQNENSPAGVDHRPIPIRSGSKYADVILQRLQSDLLKSRPSIAIGVIGCGRRQGVTTTAVNLAIRAADHGISPALLVEGNFRHPKISRLYSSNGPGLSECLVGSDLPDNCIHSTKVSGMDVLGLGQSKLAKQIVMSSPAVTESFEAIREKYRFTVVDLPVFGEPSLANALIPQLDGVLAVARYGVQRSKLEAMQEAIRENGGNVIGVIMTGTESRLPAWLARFF